MTSSKTNPEWTIVGGGIHGVHIAARLIEEAKVDPRRIRIVDPAPTLLHRWWTLVDRTGMAYLRASSVHHLDLDPYSLVLFAKERMGGSPGLFAPPYDRPAVGLFKAHSDDLIQRLGLSELHQVDAVAGCDLTSSGVHLDLASGETLDSQKLVLAVGSGERVEYPAWAPREHPRIRHIFAPEFPDWTAQKSSRIAIIGGGITAAQAALRFSAAGHSIHVVSRNGFRQKDFDTDPGWLGPKFMDAFHATQDFDARRAQIIKADRRGTIPTDIYDYLMTAIESGELRSHDTEVQGLEDLAPEDNGGQLRLQLADRSFLDVDRILLATGYAPVRPGGRFVVDLVQTQSLACASCGYPLVDQALRWHPRVHVTGPLAELELGPVAPNIAGARRAASRILAAS